MYAAVTNRPSVYGVVTRLKFEGFMAIESTIGGSGSLFVGEDKIIRLELVDADDPTVAIDMSGFAMVFDVRKKDTSPDPAIISQAPSVAGVFNPVAALNEQRGLVPLTDTQLN